MSKPRKREPVEARKVWQETPDWTADELEFMRAMQAFKDRERRPYPDCRDVLSVLKSLGYRNAD